MGLRFRVEREWRTRPTEERGAGGETARVSGKRVARGRGVPTPAWKSNRVFGAATPAHDQISKEEQKLILRRGCLDSSMCAQDHRRDRVGRLVPAPPPPVSRVNPRANDRRQYSKITPAPRACHRRRRRRPPRCAPRRRTRSEALGDGAARNREIARSLRKNENRTVVSGAALRDEASSKRARARERDDLVSELSALIDQVARAANAANADANAAHNATAPETHAEPRTHDDDAPSTTVDAAAPDEPPRGADRTTTTTTAAADDPPTSPPRAPSPAIAAPLLDPPEPLARRDDADADADADDAAWCTERHDNDRVAPGTSWGTLSKPAQLEWMRRGCDRFFCRPDPKAGRGVYTCRPLRAGSHSQGSPPPSLSNRPGNRRGEFLI